MKNNIITSVASKFKGPQILEKVQCTKVVIEVYTNRKADFESSLKKIIELVKEKKKVPEHLLEKLASAIPYSKQIPHWKGREELIEKCTQETLARFSYPPYNFKEEFETYFISNTDRKAKIKSPWKGIYTFEMMVREIYWVIFSFSFEEKAFKKPGLCLELIYREFVFHNNKVKRIEKLALRSRLVLTGFVFAKLNKEYFKFKGKGEILPYEEFCNNKKYDLGKHGSWGNYLKYIHDKASYWIIERYKGKQLPDYSKIRGVQYGYSLEG